MDVMSDLTELLQTQHLFSGMRVEQQAVSPISHVADDQQAESPAAPIDDDQQNLHLQLLGEDHDSGMASDEDYNAVAKTVASPYGSSESLHQFTDLSPFTSKVFSDLSSMALRSFALVSPNSCPHCNNTQSSSSNGGVMLSYRDVINRRSTSSIRFTSPSCALTTATRYFTGSNENWRSVANANDIVAVTSSSSFGLITTSSARISKISGCSSGPLDINCHDDADDEIQGILNFGFGRKQCNSSALRHQAGDAHDMATLPCRGNDEDCVWSATSRNNRPSPRQDAFHMRMSLVQRPSLDLYKMRKLRIRRKCNRKIISVHNRMRPLSVTGRSCIIQQLQTHHPTVDGIARVIRQIGNGFIA